jgi:DNA ligase-associated metallophosphoesterase
MQIAILDNHFELLPQRAIYWHEKAALILSDTHFGKTAHFRKAGISIPDHSFHTDIEVLDKLVAQFSPVSLIIAGDMFHSYYNREVAIFGAWRDKHPALQIHLAKGNHDILHSGIYTDLRIRVYQAYTLDSFIFSHELCSNVQAFCFSGHIHPGIRVAGPARQQLKFPCFHFSGMSCTLPAFSRFTGLSLIDPACDDSVYMIVQEEVIKYSCK